jgi:hypothetical protein
MCFRCCSTSKSFPSSGVTSLISLLDTQLANSVPASEIGLLKQKHEWELRGLQAQADRAQELAMELAKAKEVESVLRLEFDQWLAKEKEILTVKYETEVDELLTSQGAEIEKRDAEIRKLADLREVDYDRHAAELGVWHVRDRKLHAGLQGLEHALDGVFPPLLLHSYFSAPFPPSFVALVEAFPSSTQDVATAVEECRAKYHIVCHDDPKAELSSEEMMASIKGQLKPVAKLGPKQHQPIAFVF